MCAQNSRIMNAIDEELKLGREKREQLEQRRRKLLLEIQGVNSALGASKSIISGLEDQRNALCTTNQNLIFFQHPIRGCPNEILQSIFKTVVLLSSPTDWYQAARSLSQVCGRWRRIALGASLLWTHIRLYFGPGSRKFGVIEDFLQTYSQRMGSKAPAITLQCIEAGHGSHHARLIKYCNLDRFDAIEMLHLQIRSPSALEDITSMGAGYSTGPLKNLNITSNWYPEWLPETPFTWKFGDLLKNFPTTEHLSMPGWKIALEGTELQNYPSLRSIEIQSGSFSLGSSLSQLSGLTKLTLKGEARLDANIILPNLQELCVSYELFGWDELNAPKLIKLTFDGQDPAVFAFINRHPSILLVETSITDPPNHGTFLSMSLHPRVSLKLTDYNSTFVDWSDIEVCRRNLVHLTIDMLHHDRSMTSKEFEKLLKGLNPCLLSSEGAESANVRSVDIDIIGAKDYFKFAPWRNSHLLERVNQTEYREEHWDEELGATRLELRLGAKCISE